MSKHTEGPWKVSPAHQCGTCSHDGFRPDRKTPYPIYSLRIEGPTGRGIVPTMGFDPFSEDEVRANAALIASAPSLLVENEALKEQVERLRSALEECVREWGPRDVFLLSPEKLALDKARAALAASPDKEGVEG